MTYPKGAIYTYIARVEKKVTFWYKKELRQKLEVLDNEESTSVD
jgi:hypothetical protein